MRLLMMGLWAALRALFGYAEEEVVREGVDAALKPVLEPKKKKAKKRKKR